MSALWRFDSSTAIALLTRAIALHPEGVERLDLDLALGSALKFAGDASAEAELQRVVDLAGDDGRGVLEFRARVELIAPRLSRGELSAAEALDLLAIARDLMESANDQFGLGRAWHLTSVIKGAYRFQIGEAEEAATRALQQYRRVGLTAVGGIPLIAAAMHDGPTHVKEAIARCDELVIEAETPVWQSFVLPPLAGLYAMAGHFERSRELLAQARGQRREFADSGTIVTSWSWYAADVELLAQKPAVAEGILTDAIETLRATTNRDWLAANLALLGEALYLQKRYAESLAVSTEALANAHAEYLYAVSPASRVRAKSLAQTGSMDEAESAVLDAISRLEHTDALGERARTFAAAAEIFALAGPDQRSKALRNEALRLFDEKGDVASAAALAQ
jgi:hypothetical protein